MATTNGNGNGNQQLVLEIKQHISKTKEHSNNYVLAAIAAGSVLLALKETIPTGSFEPKLIEYGIAHREGDTSSGQTILMRSVYRLMELGRNKDELMKKIEEIPDLTLAACYRYIGEIKERKAGPLPGLEDELTVKGPKPQDPDKARRRRLEKFKRADHWDDAELDVTADPESPEAWEYVQVAETKARTIKLLHEDALKEATKRRA